MTLSREEQKAVTELAQPLIKFIREHGHPYVQIVITNESVEVLETISKDYDRWSNGT